MKNWVGLVLVMVTLGVNAQWQASTVKEFSEMMILSESSIPNGTTYSFNTEYNFYNDLTSNEIALKMKGEIICEKGVFLFADQLNQWMIQDTALNMIIDTINKTLIIQKPEQIYTHKKTMDDLTPFLNSNCKVEKNIQGSITKYSVLFAQGARYSGCEVWYNKNKLLVKYVLYGGEETIDDTDFYNPKIIQPRLEIIYTNYKFGAEVSLKRMKKSKDFISIKNGEIVIVNDTYKEFELIDLRMNN